MTTASPFFWTSTFTHGDTCDCSDCHMERGRAAYKASDAPQKVIAAAVTYATKLCDRVLPIAAGGGAERFARAKRYQLDEFQPNAWAERRVCDALNAVGFHSWNLDSREELLELVEAHCDAGRAEVERRFATIEP